MYSTEYLNAYGRPTHLTEAELAYFNQTVAQVRNALGVQIEISNRDHERELPAKHREALGLFYTSDPKNPAADSFITIDNYFIHECYEEKYADKLNLSGQSFTEVICHEIAHMSKFRHGKGHKELTQELMNRVEAFARKAENSLDNKIAGAATRAAATHTTSRRKASELTKE